MRFFEALANIFRIPDLRKRVAFTLALLAVYRLGGHIPIPGINTIRWEEIFSRNAGGIFGFFDMFAGGNIRRLTIFALGIMPYITASIILQLLTVVVPTLEKLSKEGELGRRKITQWTRYLTVILAVIQSTRTETSLQFLSWLGLGLVSGYGIYSSIQFIRGKSAKLLIAALTLGVIVDVMTLIALPLLQPFMQDQEKIVKQIVPDDVDDASVGILSFEERIDLKRIMFGIGLILIYAIFSIYLISPPVKKFIHSHGDRGI